MSLPLPQVRLTSRCNGYENPFQPREICRSTTLLPRMTVGHFCKEYILLEQKLVFISLSFQAFTQLRTQQKMRRPINLRPSPPTSSNSSESIGVQFLANVVTKATKLQDTAGSKKLYMHHDRVKANKFLMRDYFVKTPNYNEETFKTRFQMPNDLFLKFVKQIPSTFVQFKEGFDTGMKNSFSSLHNYTSVIKRLANANVHDVYD